MVNSVAGDSPRLEAKPGNERWFFAIALLALTVLFINSPGTSDVKIWQAWTAKLVKRGLVDGYQRISADYPPLCAAILLGSTKVAAWLGITKSFWVIKLSILVFHLAATAAFWRLTRNFGLTLLFHISALLSAALGYLDLYVAPALILSLLNLRERRWAAASLWLSLACLTKWQPLIVLPFVLIYVIRSMPTRPLAAFGRHLLVAVLPGTISAALVAWYFGLGAIAAALRAASAHPYLSGNALNANWVVTEVVRMTQPDRFGPLKGGEAEYIITDDPWLCWPPKAMFALLFGWALWKQVRSPNSFDSMLRYALLGFLAYFTFNTGAHENHLFVPQLLAFALLAEGRARWQATALVALMANANLFLFYGVDGTLRFSRAVAGEIDVAALAAAFNVLAFVQLWTTLTAKQSQLARASAQPSVV
jgi:hypothetical protein